MTMWRNDCSAREGVNSKAELLTIRGWTEFAHLLGSGSVVCCSVQFRVSFYLGGGEPNNHSSIHSKGGLLLLFLVAQWGSQSGKAARQVRDQQVTTVSTLYLHMNFRHLCCPIVAGVHYLSIQADSANRTQSTTKTVIMALWTAVLVLAGNEE